MKRKDKSKKIKLLDYADVPWKYYAGVKGKLGSWDVLTGFGVLCRSEISIIDERRLALASIIPEALEEDRATLLALLGDVAFSFAYNFLNEKTENLSIWWDIGVAGTKKVEPFLYYVAPFLSKKAYKRYIKGVIDRIKQLPPGPLVVLTHACFVTSIELVGSALATLLLFLDPEIAKGHRIVLLMNGDLKTIKKALRTPDGKSDSYLGKVINILAKRGILSPDYKPLVSVDTLLKEIIALSTKIIENPDILDKDWAVGVCANPLCRREFVRREWGRPRKFCSDRCKMVYFRKKKRGEV